MLLHRSIHVGGRVRIRAPRWLSTGPSSNSGYEEPRMVREVDLNTVDKSYRLSTDHLLNPAGNTEWKVVKHEHLKHVDIPPNWDEKLARLQGRIGVRFHDTTVLTTALIHHSALQQQVPTEVASQRLSNRSLEFLGDSILGMAIASYVFQSHPRFQEGQLTQLKSAIVNNETLSKVAENDLQISELVLVSKGYQLSRASAEAWFGKSRNTIHAGALEALIAAVYLDQGLVAALAFVNEKILPAAVKYITVESAFQPVVELQKLLQAHRYGHPVYKRVPARSVSKIFHVELFVRDELVLTGTGASYKEARINAASAGYTLFQARLDTSESKE